MRLLRSFAVAILVAAALASFAEARSFRPNQIPNGTINSCANCHINPAGGGARNAFGQAVEARFLDNSGNVIWGPQLAVMDSDGDGVPNGLELQDPYGAWKIGDPSPGNSSLVANPGDPNSVPDLSASVQIQFSGMTPHKGQNLYLRAVDIASGLEVARTAVSPVPAADFDVDLSGLTLGHSYYIDFFADVNGNGLYDPPNTDHAWRLELDDAQRQSVLQFSHNTNFTDIHWRYLLTVNFSGMNPHVGQKFFLRVKESGTGREIGRTLLPSIPAADFSVSVPGLKLGASYEVDFFADHNGDGLYEPPGEDHAWRLQASADNGDVTLNFAHNTNFVDIQWPYLLTFQLVGMNPHLGQMLEARLIDAATQAEVMRTRVPSIPLPDFQVLFPVLQPDHAYRIDFYADHNGNGTYDAPPQDHAWRIEFAYNSGDTTVIFFHNTNFTDIQWPGATAVARDPGAKQPIGFALEQNYPNPFNPATAIPFRLPRASHVRLVIFNSQGQAVRTLVDSELPPGAYTATWNGRDENGRPVSAGIYFYQLRAGAAVQTRRMLMLK